MNRLDSNIIIPWLIQQAEALFGPGTGEQKKAWVVGQVVGLLELVDHQVPIVGPYMDLKFVDSIEAALVAALVQEVFDRSNLAK